MSTLSQIVREEYMHIFACDNYLENWAAQIGAVTPPPIIGDLNHHDEPPISSAWQP